MAVASAGPYASLHLAPDRQLHQHPPLSFFVNVLTVIAKFHYTGPTGPDQTKSADFVGDPRGLCQRPGSAAQVLRKSARASGQACVVKFSLNNVKLQVTRSGQ